MYLSQPDLDRYMKLALDSLYFPYYLIFHTFQLLAMKKIRTIPADVYDTLELSAYAHGGIGAGSAYEREKNEWGNMDFNMDRPLCMLGHLNFVSGPDTPFHKLLRPFFSNDITSVQNDNAVYAINERLNRPVYSRVSFEEWCAELNIVRGE